MATLGTDLNSDFDEDEPYNRDDSQGFTTDIFKSLDSDFSEVMTDGSNAFTWKYVDYILNVPLDSSRYNRSSNAVPFIGVVLHSYVQMAGSPINMEGNIGYSFLKAIENGASLSFTICYQNYEKLKDDRQLSQYYSVRYDILKDDIIKYYTKLNELTRDLQLLKIVDHEFLIGERVPDADEIEADLKALEDAAKAEAEAAAKKLEEELRQKALNGRIYAVETTKNALDSIRKSYEGTGNVIDVATGRVDRGLYDQLDYVKQYVSDYKQATADIDTYSALVDSTTEAAKATALVLSEKLAVRTAADTQLKKHADHIKLITALENAQKNYDSDKAKLDTYTANYDAAIAVTTDNGKKLAADYIKAYVDNNDAAAATAVLTALKAEDSKLYTAVYNYGSQIVKVNSRLEAVAKAQADIDNSPDKAAYDADKVIFDAADAEYLTAKEADDAAKAAKNQASTNYRNATTAQSTALRKTSGQVNTINSIIKKIANQRQSAKNAADNAAYAAEVFMNDPQYSADFKADVKNSNEESAKYAAEVEALFLGSLDIVAQCYAVASEIVEKIPELPSVDGSTSSSTTVTTQPKEDEGYTYTKYTEDGGNIVKVVYEDGTFFILNYNYFDVNVTLDGTTYRLAANGGVKVGSGNTVYFDVND